MCEGVKKEEEEGEEEEEDDDDGVDKYTKIRRRTLIKQGSHLLLHY